MRILLAAILFSFVSVAMSQPSETTVDALFKAYAGPTTPGAAVMVIKDGKPVFTKGYGMADLEKRIPCSTNTNFRLASVTKQFTAMAILTLAERGKLSLEDRVPKYFPEFPEYGKGITIRHLLTHTSGVPDYEDDMPDGLKIPLSDRDVLHILRQQKTLYFSPGSDFRYSNSGYAMLALLVEIASGETFPAYLEKHIFKPLGMNDSIAYVAGVSQVPNRAFGYALENGKWNFSDQSLTSAVLGDGGIYSSVADLLKWDQALYTGKLVGRKMLEEAFTPHSQKSDFAESGYGYGWYIGKVRGTNSVWHYGSTCGFRTHFARFPEKNLSVIILTNRREPELNVIAEQTAALFW
ncbi:MAG: beta-lactamase family protein [Verrucomicrobia bacterium]|nr:beta-lactamase family protein [Verrucomicrobiota bacterium]